MNVDEKQLDWQSMKDRVTASLEIAINESCGEIGATLSKDQVWVIGGLVEALDRLDSLARYRKDTDKFYELRKRIRSITNDVPRIFALPANSPSGYVPMAVVQPLLDMAEALKEITIEIDTLDL